MIIVKTPMRVSLFGGGTDYPAYSRVYGGAVLGLAVDKYVWTSVRKLPPFFPHKYRVAYSKVELALKPEDIKHPAVSAILRTHWDDQHGLEVHHDADLPALSGMGSSSSFAVGLINALYALQGRMTTRLFLAKAAIYAEREVVGETVGEQDQVWAAYGGLNRIDFYEEGGFSVSPVVLSRARRNELTSSIVLYFTGLSRHASEIAAAQVERVNVNIETLHWMKNVVGEAQDILCDERKPLRDLGLLLDEAWRYKRSLAGSVSNQEIDEMYQAGLSAGAWGGKLLGAGGGGFLMFLCPHSHRASLRSAMRGKIEINVEIDYEGSKVVLYQPNGL